MKRTVLRVFLLIAYWIPFAFLAMYGDREMDTLGLYVFVVVDMAILCWACMKYRCPEIMIGGNVITTVSSYFCLQQMLATEQGEYWGAYFKPFTPTQMIFFLMGLLVVLQLFWVHALKKRAQRQQAKLAAQAPKSVKSTHGKPRKKRK